MWLRHDRQTAHILTHPHTPPLSPPPSFSLFLPFTSISNCAIAKETDMPVNPRSSTRAATAAAAASLKKSLQFSNSQNQHDGDKDNPLNKTNADEMSAPTVRIPGHLRPTSKPKRPVSQDGFQDDEEELQQTDPEQNTAAPHPRSKKLKQLSSGAPDDVSRSMGVVGSAIMYELDQNRKSGEFVLVMVTWDDFLSPLTRRQRRSNHRSKDHEISRSIRLHGWAWH